MTKAYVHIGFWLTVVVLAISSLIDYLQSETISVAFILGAWCVFGAFSLIMLVREYV